MQIVAKTYEQTVDQLLNNDWTNDAYKCLATRNDDKI